jgi:hypothetical protein
VQAGLVNGIAIDVATEVLFIVRKWGRRMPRSHQIKTASGFVIPVLGRRL